MSVKRMLLPGIDYFQLLLDHHSKAKGGSGHEARLAIYLDEQPGEDEVRNLIHENETCRKLSRARITKHAGAGYPALFFIDDQDEIPVSFHHEPGMELPARYLQMPVDVFKKPPLHLQVIYFGNGQSCLVFTFHHILFDFAGVQSFIKSLSGKEGIPLLPVKPVHAPFPKRLRNFFKAVAFTFREANWNMMIPERFMPAVKKHKIVYREHEFTRQESLQIDEHAKSFRSGLNPGMFQLACVSQAMHQHIFSKQVRQGFLWIPVPVNIRKRGVNDALLFNGLTFLFYKLFPKDLVSLEKTVSIIRNQMADQVRRDLPQAFVDFSDGYRYVPMFFYYPMLQLPSLGQLCSFNFSTLGNTFEDFDEFLGKKVLDVRNYPSNAISPGNTFLFYRFRGQLRLMTSWVEGQYTPQEQTAVLKSIAGLMVGD